MAGSPKKRARAAGLLPPTPTWDERRASVLKPIPSPDGVTAEYQSDYADMVLMFCGQGYSLSAFAGWMGRDNRTINRWRKENPEFDEACDFARARCVKWWEDQAIKNVLGDGTGGGKATMIIFALLNHAPETFKQRQSHEVTGKGGAPIEHTAVSLEERQERARAMIREAFAPRLVVDHSADDVVELASGKTNDG